MKKKPADIKEKVDIVLRENKYQKRVTQIRVVRWVVDGIDKGPKLEKRNFMIGTDGVIRAGRCAGFNREEFNFLVENKEDIESFLK